MRRLVILRGPQCSGKTEISEKLKERLDETKHKKTYLLKLDEINTERFDYSLNEALNKKYNYIVGELNYGDSHTADPMRTWLQRFKDKDFHIVSIVLEASREMRLLRCRKDPKRNPFDKIDEMFFNYDNQRFDRLQRDRVFQKNQAFMKQL